MELGCRLLKISPGTGARGFAPLVSLLHANICSAISFSGLHLEFMVYSPLEAAGSARVNDCSRQGLCTSTSAALKISVFTNSMLFYSVVKVFLDMFCSRTGPMCKKEGTLTAVSNSRQSFTTSPNFYEHFHNGISNTWATIAVTVDASYIIICFLFKK